MRLELTRVGLLVELANHYTTTLFKGEVDTTLEHGRKCSPTMEDEIQISLNNQSKPDLRV